MKIRRPPRRVQTSPSRAASSSVSDLSASITASHARQINELPKYQRDVVTTSLREGIKPAQIAYYFGEMGWLTVTEKTFTQYIQAFRRIYPEKIGAQDDDTHLDYYVDPRSPHIDEEAQLEQLIRVQKVRLGVGLKFEKNTGIINQHLHKDFNATTSMIETLAKMRGKMMGAGRPSHEAMHPISNEAKEQMRASDQAENAQSKLSGLFEKLGNLMEARKNVETS